MTLKIKHLKVKTNSDWLAYQSWLPVALRAKAEQLGVPSKYLVPVQLTKAAPVSQISNAIDDCNQRFDDLCRFIRNSAAGDVSKAEAGKAAKGFLEARGIAQGSLVGVDVMSSGFDGILSDALGIHENQHHPIWDKVYPETKRLPEALVKDRGLGNRRSSDVQWRIDAEDGYVMRRVMRFIMPRPNSVWFFSRTT